MSLLNISFLNEAIIEKKMEKPGEVFDYVRKRLIENISTEGGQDGMDAILVCFDKTKNTITYAAAHNAPLIIRKGEAIQLPTDKMPVGKGEKSDAFATREIQLLPGDTLYLYTDGFADQFGGPNGKKFKETNLKKLFASIADLPMDQQKERLAEEFENWKGELEQIDDTLIIGVRI
jgi:serine phosphatase RsbU (regulator of sigma subunit)